MKKFRFTVTKLSEDENLIKINYIDYNYFKEDYSEGWLYNKTYFNVTRVKGKSKIDVIIENDKINSVFLYLGSEDTHLLVNNKILNLLEDLRDKVYDIKDNSLKNYLKEFYKNDYDEYYHYYYIDIVNGVKIKTEKLYIYFTGNFNLFKIDKKLFKLGNMFSTKEEAKKILEKLLDTKVKDIKKVFKEQRIFLNNMIESGLFYE